MKASRPAAVLSAVVLSLVSLLNAARAQDTAIPVGSLTASASLVKVGTKPTLNWNITYPQVIKEIVTITPPGTVTPKVKCKVEARVLGASVRVAWLNALGIVLKTEWAPTEGQIKVGGGSYNRFFYNTQPLVNPNTVLYTNTVNAGVPLNFAGRYNWDGWSDLYTSSSGRNVVALINGDTPPTTIPLYQQPTIEDFIKPYLDSAGKIKIGPKDVIYLFELTHTNPNDGGFDLQDLAVLVTFTPVP